MLGDESLMQNPSSLALSCAPLFYQYPCVNETNGKDLCTNNRFKSDLNPISTKSDQVCFSNTIVNQDQRYHQNQQTFCHQWVEPIPNHRLSSLTSSYATSVSSSTSGTENVAYNSILPSHVRPTIYPFGTNISTFPVNTQQLYSIVNTSSPVNHVEPVHLNLHNMQSSSPIVQWKVASSEFSTVNGDENIDSSLWKTSSKLTPFTPAPTANGTDNVIFGNHQQALIQPIVYHKSTHFPTFSINQEEPHYTIYTPTSFTNTHFTQAVNTQFPHKSQLQVEPTLLHLCNTQISSSNVHRGIVSPETTTFNQDYEGEDEDKDDNSSSSVPSSEDDEDYNSSLSVTSNEDDEDDSRSSSSLTSSTSTRMLLTNGSNNISLSTNCPIFDQPTANHNAHIQTFPINQQQLHSPIYTTTPINNCFTYTINAQFPSELNMQGEAMLLNLCNMQTSSSTVQRSIVCSESLMVNGDEAKNSLPTTTLTSSTSNSVPSTSGTDNVTYSTYWPPLVPPSIYRNACISTNQQEQPLSTIYSSSPVNINFTDTVTLSDERFQTQTESMPHNLHNMQAPSPIFQRNFVSSYSSDFSMENADEGNDNLPLKTPISNDLVDFARKFKLRRIKLGYTQAEVGLSLGNLYGKVFSQTTISRFEALQLNSMNMGKLKPLLSKWLDEANSNCMTHTTVRLRGINRKKRTSVDGSTKLQLEQYFTKIKNPTHTKIDQIAEQLQLDREFVKVWFSNRRQKEKRMSNFVTGPNGEMFVSNNAPLLASQRRN